MALSNNDLMGHLLYDLDLIKNGRLIFYKGFPFT